MRAFQKKSQNTYVGCPVAPSIDFPLGKSWIHPRILMDFTSRDVMEHNLRHEDLGFDRNEEKNKVALEFQELYLFFPIQFIYMLLYLSMWTHVSSAAFLEQRQNYGSSDQLTFIGHSGSNLVPFTYIQGDQGSRLQKKLNDYI